jgi:hypothetical protein
MLLTTIPILEQPKLPDEVREAYVRGNLVIFVGAGISKLEGMMGWDDFAAKCITYCRDTGLLDYANAERLRTLQNPRRKLTVVWKIIEDEGNLTDLQRHIQTLFTHKSQTDESHIYFHLNKLVLNGVTFITTNYDLYLDECFYPLGDYDMHLTITPSPKIRSGLGGFGSLSSDTLYKLHGSLVDPEKMIVTLPHYLNHYRVAEIQNFLGGVFDGSKTVLFIGYGLEEYEILDYIVLKRSTPSFGTNFLLAPYRGWQDVEFTIDQKYFGTVGIQVIPYSTDKNNYQQLCIVLSDWIDELNQLPSII